MAIVSLIYLGNDIRYGGYMLGMDSYYTSIPVMLQSAYWGIKAIGSVNPSRKGFGKTFKTIKQTLKKDWNPNRGRRNTKTAGFEKGFYRYRTVDGEPLVTVVRKDSKVMMYLTNFVATSKHAVMQRYDRTTNSVKQISFWVGHKIFNFLYGMVDQATS